MHYFKASSARQCHNVLAGTWRLVINNGPNGPSHFVNVNMYLPLYFPAGHFIWQEQEHPTPSHRGGLSYWAPALYQWLAPRVGTREAWKHGFFRPFSTLPNWFGGYLFFPNLMRHDVTLLTTRFWNPTSIPCNEQWSLGFGCCFNMPDQRLPLFA